MTKPVGSGRLNGHVALVTGGLGGIGRAVSRLFVAEGARVVACDVVPETAVARGADLDGDETFTMLDVRHRAQWDAAVALATDTYGAAPTILVHAAGIMVTRELLATTEDDFRRTFEVNVLGALHGIQAVAPGMTAAKTGSIVVLSSATGPLMGTAGLAAYGASKAANASIVKTAALELGHSGIRVNALAPGGVETPMSRSSTAVDMSSFFARMPVPRIGQPEDIAEAALYFASDASSWVTGTIFTIDGGMLAGLH